MKFSIVLGQFLVLIILFNSCSSSRTESINSDGSDFNESLTFEVSGQFDLKLDSTTGPETHMLQYLQGEGNDEFAYLNRIDQSIRFFDIETGEQLRRIGFTKQGPNKVLQLSGFLIHNKDSIFLTDAYSSNYLVNGAAEVKRKYPVDNPDLLERAPGPYVFTGSPMIVEDGRLFYQGYYGGVFDQPNMVSLDLNTDEIKYFNGYPSFYQEAYWRGGFEYMYYTYNSKKRVFVFSYAADHHVRVVEIDDLDSSRDYYASSPDFKTLKAPRQKMDDPGGDQDERKFMTQSSFGLIHYDIYNDLYYRFAFDGMPATDYDSGAPLRSTMKPARIIILNSDFNKIGEHKLDRFKFELHSSFVGEKGLYLKLKEQSYEDLVQFTILSPRKAL